MNIEVMRNFFMVMTIINGILLIVTFLMCSLFGNLIHKIHSKMFPIKRETFDVVIYSLISVYKVFFIMFNVVPFIALLLMK